MLPEKTIRSNDKSFEPMTKSAPSNITPDEKPATNSVQAPAPITQEPSSARAPDAPRVDPSKSEHKRLHTERYFNRELSWLEFNARVLAEAALPSVPLLERLKFLSIFTSNLDEFFMVRVAGLMKMVQEDIKSNSDSPDALPGERVLTGIRARVAELSKQQFQILREEVLPALAKEGLQIMQIKDLPDDERAQLAIYYKDNVLPVLTPLAVDPAHPFPFITNLALYLVVLFKEVNYRNPAMNPPIGLVEVPGVLPRLIPIPRNSGSSKVQRFILLEDLVASNISGLFMGFEVSHSHVVRVTRNLDYTLLENEVVDLLKSVQRELTNREHQEAVRLQVSGGQIPKSVLSLLLRELHLTEQELYEIDGPLFIPGLMPLYQTPRPDLKDPPFNPRLPMQMMSNEDMFSLIAREDILLHHPYDSFYPVIEFLQVAAHDPNVLAIKQTLYRSGGDSPIIEALIAAAENGKQVTAVVELKARFDEKNNISWARRLERAGVNVVFGFVGLKTHAKSTLVVRKEGAKLARYAHLSTGNYNSNTAKLYTDMSLFTSNPDLVDDISNVFNLLTGFNILSGESKIRRKLSMPQLKKIAVSPLHLRSRLMKLLDREIEIARAGKESFFEAKVNSVTDQELIDKLYEASSAGVKVRLLVRGMCCLRPGVKGLSENIEVSSIIDRFLEHSRVYHFCAGGAHEVYLGSADFSPRNMDRRVELMFPVEFPDLNTHIRKHILKTLFEDNVKAWLLQPDGSYMRRRPGPSDKPQRAQARFIELARDYGIKSLPYELAIKYNPVKEKGGRPVAKSKKTRDQ